MMRYVVDNVRAISWKLGVIGSSLVFLHSKYAVSGDYSQVQQIVGIVWAIQTETWDHVGQHDLPSALGCGNADFLAKTRMWESLPALRFWTVYNFPAGSWPTLFGWLHMRKVQERNKTNFWIKFSITRIPDKPNEENNVEMGWQYEDTGKLISASVFLTDPMSARGELIWDILQNTLVSFEKLQGKPIEV